MQRRAAIFTLAVVGCASGATSNEPPRPAVAEVVSAAPLNSVVTLGPMVGHTTGTEAWIWVQPKGPVELDAQAFDPQGGMVEAELEVTGPTPALLRLEGLRPNTHYRVRLEADDRPVRMNPQIAFRTFPRPGERTRLRIALVSCARVLWDSTQTIWGAVAADRPDVVLWLGDNNYFEDGDSTRPADATDPERMAFKYAELRALPTLQPLLRQAVHYAIWDDHDYADGEPDRTFPLKREVTRVFERFWANPSYGAGPGEDGIYSSVVMGDVEVFLTDDRFFRDPEDSPRVPEKTLLGREQLRWLKERLAASRARLKIIAVGVQVLADYHQYDGYLHYPEERAELMRWIRSRRIGGVVFVSGDRHLSELMRDDERVGYPLYELTASPVGNRVFTTGLEQPNPIRIGGYADGFNYGLLDVDTVSDPATLTFRLKDAAGAEVLHHAVPLDALRLERQEPASGGY
ncbi:MAG TPA: alkaline phosphatase D family protein [Gemmatimonadota bacterium]|nr:alkaline phosphatase D family protein [Gemmatimonadota bacterium]